MNFQGYRIAQISDLHDSQFGENNCELVEALKKNAIDSIVITGDVIDSYQLNEDCAFSFLKQAVEVAPCYFVLGNHESRLLSSYEEFCSTLKEIGITVLNNESVTIEKDRQKITLSGVRDPSFQDEVTEEVRMQEQLSEVGKADGFQILLSHRPELFDLYVDAGFDLVFSGHAHGGQIRLPYIGGLYAPQQGSFPKYDAGLYKEKSTTMVLSRGLGNSSFPIRIHNRPELVIVTLERA